MFKELHILFRRACEKVRWHFFATSHDKCAVDAVGGTPKRQIWTSVKTRGTVITSFHIFVATAPQLSLTTAIIPASNSKCADLLSKLELDALWDGNGQALCGTRDLHCIDASGPDNVQYKM